MLTTKPENYNLRERFLVPFRHGFAQLRKQLNHDHAGRKSDQWHHQHELIQEKPVFGNNHFFPYFVAASFRLVAGFAAEEIIDEQGSIVLAPGEVV